MSKGDHLELEGTIEEAMGGGYYKVLVTDSGTMVRAKLSGKMKQRHIRVLPGDKVRVMVSPYDMTHGMVSWRYR